MLRAIAVALLAVGCMSSDDPTSSSSSGVDDSYCASRGTFCASFGSSCNRSWGPLCDRGDGWCSAAGVCRPFCSAVNFPHCQPGLTEQYERDGEAGVCYCVPG